MSGGDGRGHKSGAHSTGGVKGSSGKGGPSSGKGGYDGHNLGGHTTNNGNGTSTTTDNRGSITHQSGGSSGGGVHWGGGSGHGNGGGQGTSHSGGVNLSLFPEAQASVAFGAPMNISLIDNMWGLSVFRAQPVQDAVAAALAKLTQEVSAVLPYAGRLAGVAFGLLVPSPIAPDDKKTISRIVTTLPADKVTKTPETALPTQPATVEVHTRIADVVQDEKQHLAVVSGKPMSIPVVDAKPTKRPGVYTAEVVPGKPALHIKVETGKPAALSQPKGITPEKGGSRPAGFTAGARSQDAVIRFPKESGQKPVYVSVTEVLTPAQLKQRQDEEKRRQQEWEATHPVDVAERNYRLASDELNRANADVASKQKRQASAAQALSARKGELDTANKTFAAAKEEVKKFERFADPLAGAHAMWQEAGRNAGLARDAVNQKQAEFNAAVKEKANADAALNAALESRKQKEKKAKDAESKLNDEKNKPRKGATDYGHNYFRDPKTTDIKGFGELKEGKPKTPKQGGGGNRARWYGDKNRKIYEWDSQHGELEGYRSSDGGHLGAFDPKTGKQVKGPDPKRNIKKYL